MSSTSSPAKIKKLSPIMNSKRKDYISWNDYFMANAILASKRSKDPVTQVGAVIVNEDKRIVAIGYNGFPNQCSDDEFPWYKRKDIKHIPEADCDIVKKMFVVHAEANAILNKNCASLKNTSLYTTLFPCNECAKLIVQSGIAKIYYLSDKYSDKPVYRTSRLMLDAAKIEYFLYKPATKRIIIDFDEMVEDE